MANISPHDRIKAKNLYRGWTEGGPKYAVYDVNKNGWFDGNTFQRWFHEIFLPVAIKKNGTTVLIGDNLGCHFSPDVIQATIRHGIKFITLPPNATHLCQPLDVAVFRGLKESWRRILAKWRIETRIKGAIPKENLPTLLHRLMNTVNPDSLISGFKGTGIYPLDKNEVIKRLPGKSKDPGGDDTMMVLNDSVLNILKENLDLGQGERPAKKKRGPKVQPGKRILHFHGEESGPSSAPDNAGVVDDDWFCGVCSEKWEEDTDNVWIQCDRCDTPFHLQCCGIEYDKDDYYHLDIESFEFICRSCLPNSDNDSE